MTNSLLILIVVLGVIILGLAFGVSRIISNKRGRRRTSMEDRDETSQASKDYYVFIKPKIVSIEKRLDLIEKQLKLTEADLPCKKTEITPQLKNELTWSSRPSDTPSPVQRVPDQSPDQKLISDYNAALENENDRARFRNQYPILRIGVLNVMERRRDSNLQAVFQTAPDGDYYAIERQDQSTNEYTVVPRFDLTLQESNLIPGAIGEVFGRDDINPSLRYRKYKLIWPALFKREGDKWTLIRPGDIELGSGD